MAHAAQVEHHKEGASGYAWSYTVCIRLPLIDDVECHTQTHHQLKNWHQWPHGSLSGVSAAEHHTSEQNSNTSIKKPRKLLIRSNLSPKTHQDFLKISSLWEAALERKRSCFSKVILHGTKCHSQDNKVIRLLQHSQPIVNVGERGCIVRDQETIIVVLAFNFILQRSHH